jgi:hypothetical protein
MWLQQNGASSHFGRQVTALLSQNFPDRWIGQSGAAAWPARSPDLSPLAYFLWGNMKSLVYAMKSRYRADLLD